MPERGILPSLGVSCLTPELIASLEQHEAVGSRQKWRFGCIRTCVNGCWHTNSRPSFPALPSALRGLQATDTLGVTRSATPLNWCCVPRASQTHLGPAGGYEALEGQVECSEKTSPVIWRLVECSEKTRSVFRGQVECSAKTRWVTWRQVECSAKTRSVFQGQVECSAKTRWVTWRQVECSQESRSVFQGQVECPGHDPRQPSAMLTAARGSL